MHGDGLVHNRVLQYVPRGVADAHGPAKRDGGNELALMVAQAGDAQSFLDFRVQHQHAGGVSLHLVPVVGGSAESVI